MAKYTGRVPPKWIGKAQEKKGKKMYKAVEIDGVRLCYPVMLQIQTNEYLQMVYKIDDDIFLAIIDDEKPHRAYGRLKSMWEVRNI